MKTTRGADPHKEDPIADDAPIPTPDEVDKWIIEARDGYATPNFIGRLTAAYRKLYFNRVGQRRRRR